MIVKTLISIALIIAWVRYAWVLVKLFWQEIPLLSAFSIKPPETWPKLSVIVTAKDEGEHIRRVIQRLGESTYPNLEIIAVNDRSEDDTKKILEKLDNEISNLKVINLDELPPEWIGKCHACWQGARSATGEWLLFMDGDVHLEHDALEKAVAYAHSKRVDHLCVIPGTETDHPLEAGMLSSIFQLIIYRSKHLKLFSGIGKGYIGVGAFNLVKRSAYSEIGGHAALKMEVIDDVMLGYLIKKRGLTQQVVNGFGLLEIRWQKGCRAIIKGLEKNYFAALDYKLSMLFFTTLFLMFFHILPIFWFFSGAPLAKFATVLFWIALASIYTAQSWTSNFPKWIFILHPISISLLIAATWRSAFLTIKQGGIKWRGTFYPLKELKKHNRLLRKNR